MPDESGNDTRYASGIVLTLAYVGLNKQGLVTLHLPGFAAVVLSAHTPELHHMPSSSQCASRVDHCNAVLPHVTANGKEALGIKAILS